MAQIIDNAELKNEVDVLAERMGRLHTRIREAATTEQLREEISLYWWQLVEGVDRIATLTQDASRP